MACPFVVLPEDMERGHRPAPMGSEVPWVPLGMLGPERLESGWAELWGPGMDGLPGVP